MNTNQKIINRFLRNHKEFGKITLQNKELVVSLFGSKAEYKVCDFSLSSPLRAKLEALEAELGIPVS